MVDSQTRNVYIGLNKHLNYLQEVAEKTTELEMELTTARKSLHKLQEEKDHLQEELQSAMENKTGVEESLNQLTEVKHNI